MPDSRPCPSCGQSAEAGTLFLAANLDESRLNALSYASRKPPEYMNHRLVRCTGCDLVFADTPPAGEDLANAYHVAEYDSVEEGDDAASAYIAALRQTLDALPSRQSALEIGSGTGIFLEHLAKHGFSDLVGIEPSRAAIEAAPPTRQSWIREGVFERDDFSAESFDLICCFMTMEHVPDPKVVTDASLELLRPGGALATVTHDYRSRVNRLLKHRSPIIDIEHLQLFSQQSARHLFESSGFERIEVRAFRNRYSLQYWWRLAPSPKVIKKFGERFLTATRLGRIKVSLNVGNILTVGFKPLD